MVDWLSRRPAALAIAAFNTWGNDGLIPQLKQGGRDICELAVAGSKLLGTGLAKEQITQTHVALFGLGVLDPELKRIEGLAFRYMGEALELLEGDCAADWGLRLAD